MHPGFTSTEHCIKSPALKMKTFFGETIILEKMLTFLENIRPFLCKKLCVQIPTKL